MVNIHGLYNIISYYYQVFESKTTTFGEELNNSRFNSDGLSSSLKPVKLGKKPNQKNFVTKTKIVTGEKVDTKGHGYNNHTRSITESTF